MSMQSAWTKQVGFSVLAIGAFGTLWYLYRRSYPPDIKTKNQDRSKTSAQIVTSPPQLSQQTLKAHKIMYSKDVLKELATNAPQIPTPMLFDTMELKIQKEKKRSQNKNPGNNNQRSQRHGKLGMAESAVASGLLEGTLFQGELRINARNRKLLLLVLSVDVFTVIYLSVGRLAFVVVPGLPGDLLVEGDVVCGERSTLQTLQQNVLHSLLMLVYHFYVC